MPPLCCEEAAKGRTDTNTENRSGRGASGQTVFRQTAKKSVWQTLGMKSANTQPGIERGEVSAPNLPDEPLSSAPERAASSRPNQSDTQSPQATHGRKRKRILGEEDKNNQVAARGDFDEDLETELKRLRNENAEQATQIRILNAKVELLREMMLESPRGEQFLKQKISNNLR